MATEMQRLTTAIEELVRHERAKVDDLEDLKEAVEGALYPPGLLRWMASAANVYNATERRFEVQRSPNLMVVADDLTTVALVDIGIDKSATPQNATPKDNMYWRVLGGFISGPAGIIDLKDGSGGPIFFHGAIAAAVATPFAVPANGFSMTPGKIVNVNCEAGGIVDLILYVCEERTSQIQTPAQRGG